MAANGWRGATRARRVRTTVADPTHNRAPDLVRRRFRVGRPDALHVADFTYVPMAGGGFGYTAFVIDAYAGLIPGWECSLTKNTAFVERAIRAAAARRAREGRPLSGVTNHHSDAGSQYTAIHFTETLMLAGLIPSVGTVGDALDNALAETTIGLYKTECVREDSPFRNGPSSWPPWRRCGTPSTRRTRVEIAAAVGLVGNFWRLAGINVGRDGPVRSGSPTGRTRPRRGR